MRAVAYSLFAAGMLSSCAAGPDYVRPPEALPTSYSPSDKAPIADQAANDKDLPALWWELFHSSALNQLVQDSLKHNPNIDAARAALKVAQENVHAQRGFFYPNVEASFSPTRQKVAKTLASPAFSGANYYSLYTAQVSVSYTLDVFGANRRQVESLQAQADMQRFELEASYLSLSSNVVSAAIAEAGLRGQIRATHEIIAEQEKLTAMFRRQLALGQVSENDLATQEAAQAAAEAALPPLEKQLALQRDLIKVLAGRFPSDTLDASFELESLQLPGELPLSLPSTLVEHRPDIRAAEEQLHAASAEIGVAVANRLPNITLGVNSYGSSALSMADLFKSGTGFWEVAGGITQPIFDGGTLKHRQGAAEAAYEQAAAQYRATVQNAFQNVADSLQALQSDDAALRAADKALKAAEKSLSIARRQLQAGDISALMLLNAEQTCQQAKLNEVQARTNRLSDTVALFQSLGGGWWNRLAATP
ncbi:MAG: efflux transporter outer membrane subunit [Burkholderiaceae bacterium]|nr:efflux transporter outer membrane subunit [Burkholderiaceae bacterium]